MRWPGPLWGGLMMALWLGSASACDSEVRPQSLQLHLEQTQQKPQQGSISGKLTDKRGGAGLAGVSLFAETIGPSARVTIVRTAVSAGDGSYTLPLLPLGQTYYVV